jgi:hypothetical protein
MTIKESVQAHLTLVHVFHMMPQRAIHGCPVHYLGLHHCMYGGIASDSATIGITKFTGSHKFHIRQYILETCPSRPNRHGP